MNEEQYKKELAAAGVEIPETEAEKEPEGTPPAEEAPAETPKEPEAETPKEPEVKKEKPAPLQDEPKPQKRSIYDDYKDLKAEKKTEKEAREAAERENAELKQKLEALGKADTPEEKKEATDDLEAFALKIKADPQAIREMFELFSKRVTPATDPALAEGLKKFQDWQSQNSKVVEQAEFEKEFTASAPKLKELFPNASPEEMNAIKAELDTISHTKEWHDKSLAYVAFEHKDKLSALISPHKRGMEGTKKRQDTEADSFEFDPNADYSKMTPKEREAWETNYKEMTKGEGLITGANGKKLII